jgi:hypothetical protein
VLDTPEVDTRTKGEKISDAMKNRPRDAHGHFLEVDKSESESKVGRQVSRDDQAKDKRASTESIRSVRHGDNGDRLANDGSPWVQRSLDEYPSIQVRGLKS